LMVRSGLSAAAQLHQSSAAMARQHHFCLQTKSCSQKLLDQTDMPLSDIALGCGFADQAHLCEQFRVITDETPAAWRRAKKAQDADMAVLHSPCRRIRRSQCYFNMSARHVAHSSPRALAVDSA
jgi:AraC-like DNA-binding protein